MNRYELEVAKNNLDTYEKYDKLIKQFEDLYICQIGVSNRESDESPTLFGNGIRGTGSVNGLFLSDELKTAVMRSIIEFYTNKKKEYKIKLEQAGIQI